MVRSDLISGVLLIFFSAIALWPRFDFVGRWRVSFVGGWLQFAPLIFWAKSPAPYLNDRLVGGFAIVLSPGTHDAGDGASHGDETGADHTAGLELPSIDVNESLIVHPLRK